MIRALEQKRKLRDIALASRPPQVLPIHAPAALPVQPTRCPRSAVFELVEIRQSIIRLLDQKSLVTFMRVRRSCMREVAEIVYFTISCKRAQYGLERHTSRGRMYCDCVQIVNARSDAAPPSLTARLNSDRWRRGGDARHPPPADREDAESESETESESGSDSDSDSDSISSSDSDCEYPCGRRGLLDQKYLRAPKYDAVAFGLIVTSLRRKLPHLRRIDFGSICQNFGDDSWSVDTSPPIPPGHSTHSTTSPSLAHGHLCVNRTRRYDITYPPPETLLPIPPPTPNYTCQERFDLHLYYPHDPHSRHQDALHADWVDVLWHNPLFDNLYRCLDIGELDASLELLTDLYKRQDARGHTERLETISASDIVSWNVDDFHTFAKVASTSLVNLSLVDEWGDYQDEYLDLMFVDLATVVTIVRETLPNLRDLRIPVGGVETAEQVCALLLSADKYDQRGSISSLAVVTDTAPTPLFNVLRVLAPLCTDEASVHISTGGDEKWQAQDQTMFHRYIRRQPLNRRFHLATTDFQSIGVLSPWDVFDIQYNIEGQPTHRSGQGPSKPARRTEAELETAMQAVLAGIVAGEIDHLTAVKIIKEWAV